MTGFIMPHSDTPAQATQPRFLRDLSLALSSNPLVLIIPTFSLHPPSLRGGWYIFDTLRKYRILFVFSVNWLKILYNQLKFFILNFLLH